MDSKDSLNEFFCKLSLEDMSTPCQSLLEEANCNVGNQDGVHSKDEKKSSKEMADVKSTATIENKQDLSTSKINSSKSLPFTKPIIKSVQFELLKVESTIRITLLEVINPNYFFVRDKSQIDQVNTEYLQLQHQMKQLYDGLATFDNCSWKCGDICVARLRIDRCWHRVMLDTIGKTQAEVHCIDTGYFQDVMLEDCFPLLPCIANQKPLALACCMDNICCSRHIQYWPADIIQSFSTWLKSQHVVMTVLSTLHNIHFVQIKFYQLTKAFQASTELLKYQFIFVRNNHSERNLALNRIHNYQRILQRPTSSAVTAVAIPYKQLINTNTATVVNPSLFWLNLTRNREKMRCKINETAFNILAEKKCNIDSVILVRDDSSNKFRGQIKQFLMHNYILVQDIDSGLVSSALLGKDVAELSNDHRRRPATAMKCCLDLATHEKESYYSSSTIYRFTLLLSAPQLKVSFCSKSMDKYSVKLYKIDQADTVEINKILEQILMATDEVMECSSNNKNIPDVNDNTAAATTLNYERHSLRNNQLPVMHGYDPVTNMQGYNGRPQKLSSVNGMPPINHHYLHDWDTASLKNQDVWFDYHHQQNYHISSQSQSGPNLRLPYGLPDPRHADLGYDKHTNYPLLQQDMTRQRMYEYYNTPFPRPRPPNHPCPLSQFGQLSHRYHHARPDQTMIRRPRMPHPPMEANLPINLETFRTCDNSHGDDPFLS